MTNTDTSRDVANHAPLATAKPPIVILRERLEARASELKAALAEIPPERFIRAVVTAAQINPDILACQWLSVWLACMRACRDGLLPDGVEGAIVPYKEKATWIPMYRGLLRKFQESGHFKWIGANVVREGEEFSHFIDDTGEHFRHLPNSNIDAAVVKVYAAATTLKGGVFIAVMQRAEIDKIRKLSRAQRDDAPWNQWFDEMAKKTALRRLSKMLPSGSLIVEDEDEDDQPQLRVAAAASGPRPTSAKAALDLFAESSPAEQSAQPVSAAAAAVASVSPRPGGEASGGTTQPSSPDTASAAASASSPPRAETAHPPHESTGAQDDAPTPDAVAIAKQRGADAKQRGAMRKALPPEYRTPDRDSEAEAWFAGYDGK